ncbi:MAG: cation-transporting P-type ATPase [Cyanobacteriota bacterium]|nr:cation-transporting P-type ATPase [Cyanobacteriota bacterium]
MQHPLAGPVSSLSLAELVATLATAAEGLSQEEALRRLERYGPNRLPTPRRRPLLLRLLDQLGHFMALLLWIGGGLAFASGTPELGWAIWAVVLINGLFSFVQDYQAERALEALSRSLPRDVRVWRNGLPCRLPADQLVVGDRIALEEGERVPADCRISLALGLAVDQAALTGESQPLPRQAEADPALPSGVVLPASECTNLLLAGTTVASGRAEAFVVATGAETEFGQVARLTAGMRRQASTLERQVAGIVHTISAVAVSMGLAAFALSFLLVGLAPLDSLVFAVGIIVANVPEGLLPTVTLALALSVQRMARRRALVRRLSAVETLGSVSVICCDKTGTLTQGRMALEQIWQPAGPAACEELLLRLALLCSNAAAEGGEGGGGDPSERALLQAALGAGLDPRQERRRCPRRAELPFDSHRRCMSVVVAWPGAWLPAALSPSPAGSREPVPVLISKGAPLELLARCRWQQGAAGVEPLAEGSRAAVVAANDAMAARGMRVLAVALRRLAASETAAPGSDLEHDLVLIGLAGLYDPPRPEVPAALQRCREAGIRVTMVTGDYGLTAEAIARQIGLLDPEAASPATGSAGTPPPERAGADPVRVIEGGTLAAISDLQLRQLLRYRHRLVFARMAPEQKLRLVQAYRDLGEVVAVTGDGVNDAPALRAADVGLAMGRSGTDVAREAADIVLLDDNVATIVEAVRQGRAVVANIGRFITYVLASNVPEVAPFLAMVALRIPAALTVLQILAVDLGTDLLPALGLGAEPPEPDGMRQRPRPRRLPLLNRAVMLRAYLVLGLTEALLAMGGYMLVWRQHGVGWAELRAFAPLLLHHQAPAGVEAMARQASSVAFAVIVAGQMGALLACRSERLPFWRMLQVANPWLWAGFLSEPLLASLLVLLPPLAAVFATAPFPLAWLGWIALAPLVVLLADTLHKAWLPPGAGLRRQLPLPLVQQLQQLHKRGAPEQA